MIQHWGIEVILWLKNILSLYATFTWQPTKQQASSHFQLKLETWSYKHMADTCCYMTGEMSYKKKFSFFGLFSALQWLQSTLKLFIFVLTPFCYLSKGFLPTSKNGGITKSCCQPVSYAISPNIVAVKKAAGQKLAAGGTPDKSHLFAKTFFWNSLVSEHSLNVLPSGRRFRTPTAKLNRTKASFVPAAIHFLNLCWAWLVLKACIMKSTHVISKQISFVYLWHVWLLLMVLS